MTTLTQVSNQQAHAVTVNDNFEAVSPSALFGVKESLTTGLTFAYYGGIIGGFGAFSTIADGTVALTGSATNYIEATTAGVVSKNTSAFTAGRVPLYTAVTSASAITTLTDYRVLSSAFFTGGAGFATLTLTRQTSDPAAPSASTGIVYLKGASDAAIEAYFKRPDATVLTLAHLEGAQTFTGALTLTAAIPQLTLGVDTTTAGRIKLFGSTSGNATITTPAAAGAGITITLPATSVTLNAAGDLTGTTLASGVTASSLTSLGTIAALAAGTGVFTGAITASTAVNALTTAAESWIGPSSTTGVYFKGGNVGIGTTTPTSLLDVYGAAPAITLSDNGAVGARNWRIKSSSGNWGSFSIQQSTTNLGSTYVDKVMIDENGNVGIGTTTPGGGTTEGTEVLSLANGTAPVGGVANQVSLFSKDVTASAELFALDEAGNTPQLSPHPADFLNSMPVKTTGAYAYPWAYSSSNPYLGKRIRADFAGLFEWALANGAPANLIVIEDLPMSERADWDEQQEKHWINRESERTDRQNQLRDLATQISAEEDVDKQTELEKQRDWIKIPDHFNKKAPPQWMRDRGVKTTIEPH